MLGVIVDTRVVRTVLYRIYRLDAEVILDSIVAATAVSKVSADFVETCVVNDIVPLDPVGIVVVARKTPHVGVLKLVSNALDVKVPLKA